MIASTRGLAVLAAIAAVLALLLVVLGERRPTTIDRTLLPGFSPDRVVELGFARPGQPEVRIVKADGGWRWHEPPGLADVQTVEAVVAALRGARWHRRADASAAGTPRATVRIVGDRTLSIAIGADLPGAEQTWLAIGGRALLVDRWVATALAPEPLALRVRQPFANAAAANSIVDGETRIDGTHLVAPRTLWLAPAVVGAIHDALTAIEIVALGPHQPDATLRRTIVVDGDALTLAGRCGDRSYIETPAGNGCIERARWDALTAALATLAGPLEQIADPRPLPVAPTELVLADGVKLELAKRPLIGGADADGERVRELLAALTAPAERIARPAGTPTGTIVAGPITLELYAGALARKGEPLALKPTADHWATIRRPSSTLRDPTRWREDPTTISSITVDRVTYTRGAVLGEWTRTPPGPVDGALVDALASSLAIVRAPAVARAPVPKHRIQVTFTPPAGAPTTHELSLALPNASGCTATVDRTPVELPLELCTAAIAVAQTR